MYNLRPTVDVTGEEKILKFNEMEFPNKVVIECYHGVDYAQIVDKFQDYELICIDEYFINQEIFTSNTFDYITDDRVFGKMNTCSINDLYTIETIEMLQTKFNKAKKIVIFGVGASLIKGSECTLYIDIPRWEIQLRYRQGLTNLNRNNIDDENITKFKIGYFLDWRICDKVKNSIKYDYYVDGTKTFKVLKRSDYIVGLEQVVNTPFRMVPYFDPGIWGGNWMKETFNLPENGSNYAWSFDGVVEENSVILKYGTEEFEIPAINVLFNNPKALLGEHVYNVFGSEWPIRFDYLDTYNGDSLSLQVHPKKEYIQNKYMMQYTQDESYYIMECKDNAVVYLGLKKDIKKDELYKDLKKAEIDGKFSIEKYINAIPVQKHDHFSIPAGTVHCSGSDAVVLEISATPYIFTYKLWDWGRVGLNGIPRPLHIDDGIENIDFTRDTNFVNENLVSHLKNNSLVQKTGLYDTQPIETYRYKIEETLRYETNGTCVMGNLVSGQTVKIIANNGTTTTINYGETFIIPANIESVEFDVISGEESMILLATIKNDFSLDKQFMY